jgi:hypothetical protein
MPRVIKASYAKSLSSYTEPTKAKPESVASASPFQLESSTQLVNESRFEASERPTKAEVTFDLKSPSSSEVGRMISCASSGAVGYGALSVTSCAIEVANRESEIRKALSILNYAAQRQGQAFKSKASYSDYSRGLLVSLININ